MGSSPGGEAVAARPPGGGTPAGLVGRVLVPAVIVVSGAILGARLATSPGWTRFFDNAHWTISYSTAALLAWLGVRFGGTDEREPRRWFAIGLTAYAIGQVLWDVQVLSGWNPFPAPSDLFFLLLGPCCALGFVAALRAHSTPQQRLVAALDAGSLSFAVLALVLASYLPLRGHHSLLEIAVLVAYPLGQLTAACVGLVMVPTLRLRPSPAWLGLLGCLVLSGALWMEWNARTLAHTLQDGGWFNAMFSITTLALGLGAMLWRPVVSEDPRWERKYEGALRLLPLLVVVGASLAMAIAFALPRVSPLVKSSIGISTAIVVTLAIVRQSLLLRERDRLLEAERHFRTLFDSAQDAILLMRGLQFVDCNRSAEAMFGMTRAELCRLTPLDVSPEFQADGDRSEAKAPILLEAALRGESQSFAWRHLHRDGTPFEAEVSLDCVELPGGRILQAVVRDVSERHEAETTRRRLEDQLRQAAKLEAVGRLAGGVAHDFNNLLTVILGSSDLALNRTTPGHPLHKELLGIRESAQRAARLTAQLLAFSRKQVISPVLLDLSALVERALDMLRRLISEDVTVAFEPSGRPCTVLADPTQLEQVLINLVVNARDAMPAGGELRIFTDVVDIDAAFCVEHPDARPGPYARLCVQDSGPGVPAEIALQVFDPFFTTKEFGYGTGLGLATVDGIVRQGGGFICLNSEAGHGARFDVHLPLRTESPATRPEPGVPAAAAGGETILLVEDEPLLRDLVQRMLSNLGYRVLVSSSGPAAIALYRERLANIDLLLTDVVMPGMSGRQVYETLRAARGELRVVYLSGYTDNIVAPHGVLESGTRFLQKPFSQAELAVVVRAALEAVVAG